MKFEDEFPSLKKYGSKEKEVFRGKRVVSEPFWSESVILECCIDKQRVRDAIISLGEEREFEINLLLKELGFTKDDFISLKRWS